MIIIIASTYSKSGYGEGSHNKSSIRSRLWSNVSLLWLICCPFSFMCVIIYCWHLLQAWCVNYKNSIFSGLEVSVSEHSFMSSLLFGMCRLPYWSCAQIWQMFNWPGWYPCFKMLLLASSLTISSFPGSLVNHQSTVVATTWVNC